MARTVPGILVFAAVCLSCCSGLRTHCPAALPELPPSRACPFAILSSICFYGCNELAPQYVILRTKSVTQLSLRSIFLICADLMLTFLR